MQRIFVAGGTGFVGRNVVRALLARGFLVRCLVRPGSEAALKGFESIDRVPGDALEPGALVSCAAGCAAVVNLIGIIRERPSRGVTFERIHVQATLNLLAVAKEAGVKRFVQMSALGTRPDAASAYHRTKWKAEEAIRHSDTDWTIFRPSIIFGPGDEFVSTLAGMIRRSPVVPVLGDGQYRLQPIAVEQVAEGFAQALRERQSIARTYDVGGPDAYRFVELLDAIGAALGRPRVRKLPVPLGPVKLATRALEWLPLYPITSDQIAMLQAESLGDPSLFFHDLHITPEPLAPGLARMLRSS